MNLHHLEITHFRNLKRVSLELSPGLNIFYGENGSGKTSLLEALHFLGLGRSFRTRNVNRIIAEGSNGFAIFAEVNVDANNSLPVGIQRGKEPSSSAVKIAGSAATLIDLATLLPLQLLNADSHLLLTSGPLTRRQFLDWGAFHVEPLFFRHWQRATKIIKQRNASLKTAASYKDVESWDQELEASSNHLDTIRQRYAEQLSPILFALLNDFLAETRATLHYMRGWNSELSLKAVSQRNFSRDRQLGFTQQGPHRADLQLKVNNQPAHEVLSQGQLKLAAYALRLAQGRLLQTQHDKRCLFLIDDLPSELDRHKRALVAASLKELEGQAFVTGIELSDLVELTSDSKVFHVEQGLVTG